MDDMQWFEKFGGIFLIFEDLEWTGEKKLKKSKKTSPQKKSKNYQRSSI